MQIYVVVSLVGEDFVNIYVGPDLDKVNEIKVSEIEGCDALFVEIWENGGKIDEYRVIEDDKEEA